MDQAGDSVMSTATASIHSDIGSSGTAASAIKTQAIETNCRNFGDGSTSDRAKYSPESIAATASDTAGLPLHRFATELQDESTPD